MNKSILSLFIILMAVVKLSASTPVKIIATSDERVELVSVVMMLYGADEYNQPEIWHEYRNKVTNHFAPYMDHPVFKAVKEFRDAKLFYYGSPMTYALELDIVDGELRYTGTGKLSKYYLKLTAYLNDFYTATDFRTFYESIKPLYKPVENSFDTILSNMIDPLWINKLGTSFDEFRLVISYIAGDHNYGTETIVDGKQVPCPVMGVFNRQAYIDFAPAVMWRLPTVIMHEYLHPYCNYCIYKYYPELELFEADIFPVVKQNIKSSYSNWPTILKESLVRAVVISYMKTNDALSKFTTRQLEFDKKRGFFWIGDLSDMLDEYFNNTETYSTLEDFMPEIVKFYALMSERIINTSGS